MPFPVDRDRIARNPGLRAGQQAIFAQQAVDQGRLARVRTTDDGELERPCKQRFLVLLVDFGLDLRRFGLGADDRPEVVEQIGDAFAMFGTDRRRFAEAERKALEDARIALAALGLVGHQYDRNRLFAQPACDFFVERGQPDPRIEHEHGRIGAFEADLGLLAHATRQAFRILVFPPGGIDDLEFEPGNDGIAEAPVARDAGLVIDQREALADQTIEQRRLADVRPADDDHRGLG